MKIACLGVDEDVLRLAAAAQAAGHSIVAAYDVPSDLPPDWAWLADSTRETWEALLHGTVADAVIVSAGDFSDRREEQLRKLTQAAVPLLLVHPVCTPIMAFELEMVRGDTACPLISYFPGIRHPALMQLAELVWQGESQSESQSESEGESSLLGRTEQVVIDRTMSRRDRDHVMTMVARDTELVRRLLGPLRQVSAHGPAHDAATYENLMVTMASNAEQLARWSVAPGEDAGVLTVIGQRGRARLWLTDDPGQWRLQLPGDDGFYGDSYDADEPDQREDADADQAIAELTEVLAGRPTTPDWTELCRVMEVVDTLPISLRRGRTMELYGEEPSESGTFKGMMAAGSCGILTLVLLAFLFGSVIEGFRLPMRPTDRAAGRSVDEANGTIAVEPVERWPLLLRLWPVYPLLIFLLLQLLLFVSKKPTGGKTQRGSPPDR